MQERLEIYSGNIAHEGGTVAGLFAFGAVDDTAGSLVQGIAHGIKIGAEAGPDAHACDDNSIHVGCECVIV